MILRSLEDGPLSSEMVTDKIEAAFGVARGEFAADDLVFATMRLEELGLIERLDRASADQ